MVNALAYGIVGHLFGDYVLQNDYQAAGKKKSSRICALHCLLYTASVLAFLQIDGDAVLPFRRVLILAAALFVSHFIQDRTGIIPWFMKVNGQSWFLKNMSPWSAIMVDNTFHLAVMAVLFRLVQSDGLASWLWLHAVTIFAFAVCAVVVAGCIWTIWCIRAFKDNH